MATYLMTWNPKVYEWSNLADEAAAVADGRKVRERWSTGNSMKIRRGDRLFLLRQGEEPRGIIGSGWATTRCRRGRHFDEKRAASGDLSNYVFLRFDALFMPGQDETLSRARLRRLPGGFYWDIASSGVEIPPAVAARVERLWAKVRRQNAISRQDEELSAFEGELRLAMIRHRKRERRLRDAKIAQSLRENAGHLRCEVPNCGFDFLEVYGEIGRDFAQVHHERPLSEATGPRRVSVDELRLVCANCHAMIHRGGVCRPLAGLIPVRR